MDGWIPETRRIVHGNENDLAGEEEKSLFHLMITSRLLFFYYMYSVSDDDGDMPCWLVMVITTAVMIELS